MWPKELAWMCYHGDESERPELDRTSVPRSVAGNARGSVERRLDLEFATARVLAESRTLGEAVHQVLQAVCSKLAWDRGELWNVDRLSNTLECIETWYVTSPTENAFDRVTRQLRLAPGVDLPGRAWIRGEPVGVADAVRDQASPRARAAAAAGLHGAVAFPIRFSLEILGIMAFYRREASEPTADLLQVFTALGQQIGQFLERNRAEQALRQSEERFRSLSACSPVGIFQSDTRGLCTYTNPCCQAICGFTLQESLGDGWTRFVHPDDRERVLEDWFTAAARGGRFAGEFRFSPSPGTVRWVALRSAPMLSAKGDPLGYVGTIEDITERKRTETALRLLPQRILEAQESERKRVARELHDGVIQLLSSARFRLQPAAVASRPDHSDAREVDCALGLLDRAIQEVRRISQNLRPSELDDLGLAAAIRSLCDEFRQRTGVELKLRQTSSGWKLAPEIELILYRLVQEALTNVEKHAQATRVAVLFTRNEAHLQLTVRDNGRGFEWPPASAKGNKQAGFGLLDMEERATLANGALTLRSAPGHGTEIVVRIPVGAKRPADHR